MKVATALKGFRWTDGYTLEFRCTFQLIKWGNGSSIGAYSVRPLLSSWEVLRTTAAYQICNSSRAKLQSSRVFYVNYWWQLMDWCHLPTILDIDVDGCSRTPEWWSCILNSCLTTMDTAVTDACANLGTRESVVCQYLCQHVQLLDPGHPSF